MVEEAGEGLGGAHDGVEAVAAVVAEGVEEVEDVSCCKRPVDRVYRSLAAGDGRRSRRGQAGSAADGSRGAETTSDRAGRGLRTGAGRVNVRGVLRARFDGAKPTIEMPGLREIRAYGGDTSR